MEEQKSLKKNTIYNSVKSIFSIIYPLITFPYISRVLMVENVGKVNFGSSIVSYFSLVASLGVSTYAIRECSRVKDNREQLSRTASQIFSINIVSTIIAYLALILTMIIAKPLKDYHLLICIQSASILFTTLGADWINTAMEDFRYITARTVGMQLVSLVLMFIFVHSPEHYHAYAFISVLASSGANIINIFYHRKFCNIRFTLHMKMEKHFPRIMLLFSLMLSQTIYTNSDQTILGLIRGDYEVGLYSTAVKIYNIVNTIVASVAWVVMPQLSSEFAAKNYKKINELLKYSLNFIIVIGIPCIVGLNVITKELIYVIAGEEYLPAGIALHILSIALLLSFVGGWIGNMMMLPSGREKVSLIACIVAAITNVALNFILIPKWGLYGGATTTAIAELIGLIINSRYVEKEIKVNGLVEMLKAPLVGAAEIVVISFIVKHLFDSCFAIAIVTIIGSVFVYGGTLLLMNNQFVLGFVAPFIKRIKAKKG